MRTGLLLLIAVAVMEGAHTACAQPPAAWMAEPILLPQARSSQMYAYVNANIPPLPEFETLDEWQRYRAETKARILRLLGIDDILENHRLRVMSRGHLDREDCTIEKICYESYPGMWVSAVVWVPKGLSGTAPAIVSISGHTYIDSKAADYVQARAENLVRRGFIVLSYDYFGCFERDRLDAAGKGLAAAQDHIHSLFSYTRRTPTGIEVLDGIRAVDYLLSRPDVDPTRIAFTGESGGGNSTYWVAALDERVSLAVSVSAGGSYEQWIKNDLNYDWHQRPPGLRAFADIGTLYAMTAPRPLLIVNGTPELAEFAQTDAHRSYEYAKRIYALYGREKAIAFETSSTGHGYQADKRILLYDWLNQWFFQGKIPLGIIDLPSQPEPVQNLRVGLPEENLSIPALAERWLAEANPEVPLPTSTNQARQWQQQARLGLEVLLHWQSPESSPDVVDTYHSNGAANRYDEAGYHAERLLFEVDGDLQIPGVFVRPVEEKKFKTVILLDRRRAANQEAIPLLAAGYAVLLLDVRGTGEMEWGGGRTSNWANFVGRPAIGQWAEDISQVTTYLLSRSDVSHVAVSGRGLFGKAALYASALDERISAVAVTLDTVSYRAEAISGLTNIYADVPRILEWGDTPQLAALVAPRPLAIFGSGVPVSDNGEQISYFSPLPRWKTSEAQVDESKLTEEFDWTTKFYGIFQAAIRFQTGCRNPSVEKELVSWMKQNF
ncbi:alpha/beta hydrolase family protein [Planctomicrobium sp. SH661]|uniref:alpha/beta hydrolase family protein n=1 Tax=Planctomicrobium sp. SH661 TaxID=3448124 RepID=UPI003F5B5237